MSVNRFGSLIRILLYFKLRPPAFLFPHSLTRKPTLLRQSRKEFDGNANKDQPLLKPSSFARSKIEKTTPQAQSLP